MNELLLPVLASGGAGVSDPYFENVVLLLRGEGANGSTVFTFVDNSPSNLPITRSGDLIQGTFSPTSKESGKWGSYFDGTGDWLQYASNTAFQLGTGDFTVEGWFYFTTHTSSQTLWDFRTTSNQAAGVVYTDINGYMYYFVSNANRISYTTLVPTHRWHHITVSRVSGTTRMFLNGTQIGSNYTDGTDYIQAPLYIGASGWSTSSYFNGYISNFRVIKGTGLYSSTFTVPSSPFSAITNTQLLTCQDNRFKDNSTNNFTATKVADASISPFSPFQNSGTEYNFAALGYSTLFDGNGDYLTIADNANLRMGTGDFTIEFFINFNNITNFQTIFDKGYSSAGGIVMQTGNGNGTLVVTINGTAVITANSGTAVDTWDHYALVRNGTALTLYKNGSSVGSNTNSADINNTSSLFIGGSTGGGGYYLNGYLSNLRVVKGTAVYTGAFTKPNAKLTAITNTQLLTCQDDLLKDYSTNNWTITKTGQAVNSSYDPISNNYPTSSSDLCSVYLDGASDYLIAGVNTDWTFMHNGLNSWQISANVYITNLAADNELWCTNVNTIAAAQGCRGGVLANGAIYTSFSAGTDGYFLSCFTNGGLVRTNEWNNIVIYFTHSNAQGSRLAASINGGANVSFTEQTYVSNSPSGSTFVFSTAAPTFALHVGTFRGSVSGTGSFWNGYISDLKITSGGTSKLDLQFKNSGIVDSSRNINLLVNGDAQVRTNVKNFNNGSIFFDGSGDYVWPRMDSKLNELFTFGTGDFTIECWVYLNTTSGIQAIYDARTTNGAMPLIYFNGANLVYQVSGTGVISAAIAGLTTSTWYHIAVSRASGSTRLFLGGTQRGSTYSDSTNYVTTASSNRPIIGYSVFNDGPLNGYIDELRVTKGVGRYTANFTPPTERFPGA